MYLATPFLRKLVSMFVVVSMVVTPFSFCVGAVDDEGSTSRGSSRKIVDRFNDVSSELTYTFFADEVQKNGWITLENNAYIDGASMLVRGQVLTANTNQYPLKPEIDLGDDGDVEWGFIYTGAGKLGHQGWFHNESIHNSMDIKANVDDTSTNFRIPLNATVTKASLNIEGKFRVKQRLLINGTAQNDEVGWDVSFVGDLNGDTFADFAVGVPYNDTATYPNAGKVMVYFGGTGLDADPDIVITGTNQSDGYGYKVAPAGDVNNDGYDDLLVGAPFNDTTNTNTGRVYIYYGGSPMDSTVDVTMTGEAVGDLFGVSATGVGDINNDGYDDVVSTSPPWGFAVGENFWQYGKMYYYLGGDPMDNVADLTVQGPTVGSAWGLDIAPVGDFNNDGYDDFVLGTSSNDDACANCGKVELFLGGAVLDGTADLKIVGTGSEELGNSVAPLGDINKDGFDDFIAGAWGNKDNGTSTGAAYVFFGGNPVNGIADLTIYGNSGGDRLGACVAPGGDINNDGWLDILVGADFNDTGGASTGALQVFFGNSTLDNETDFIIPGEVASDQFGHSISGGADLNKDGFYDVLVGAHKNDNNATNGGRAYLYETIPKKPIDPVLDFNGPADPPGVVWSYSGPFYDNVTVGDFTDQLNALLGNVSAYTTDEYGNDYVDVHLDLGTSFDSEMVISNLSIFYDYDAVIDINPNSWTGDLRTELDGKIPHQDTGTTKVAIWARARSMGKLWMHSLNILTDEGPQLTTIPDLTMDEDTHVPHLLDLYDHYDDEFDPDDFLTYEIVSSTNRQFVNVTLNDSHYISVDALTGPLNDNWTGSTDVIVNATDMRGLSKESDIFTIEIVEVNDPPIFNSTPVLTGQATRLYNYQAAAIDDGGTVSFEMAQGPNGLTVDSATGLVSWTPSSTGVFDVSLKVTDGDLDTLQDYKITVSPPNDPPKITSKPLDTATVGILYTYQLTAKDPDDDPLTAQLAQHPAGMSMDDSWLVSYIPDVDQLGDQTITIEVSDGKVTVDQTYTLTVTNDGMNNVPFFVSTPPAIAVVGHAYEYKLVAMDDDNDALTFSIDDSPAGMFLTTELIEWVPGESQVGQHVVIARVTDGMAYSLQNFTVDVSPTGANHAPVIVSTPLTKATVGYTYEYQVEARDDDLDPLEYSMDTPFKRMTINPSSGLLVWHPASDAVGNQTLTVRVSDGKGFDIQTFVVEVDGFLKNGLPIFLSNPGKDARVGENYTYDPQVQDPDMDTLTYKLIEGPTGMTIELTTGTIRWTPAQGMEGNVTVELQVSDGKGYSTQRFTIQVKGGDITVVLTVIIDSPNDGAEVSGKITIQGTAAVNIGEVFEVQIKIDKKKFYPAQGTDSWTDELDTSTLKNGRHTIYVRAWDGDIYSDVETVEIVVNNKVVEPEEKPFVIMGMDGFLFLLIIIILLIVVIGIAMAMKGGPKVAPPASRRRREDEPRPRDRARARERRRDEYEDDYEDERDYEDDYDNDRDRYEDDDDYDDGC